MARADSLPGALVDQWQRIAVALRSIDLESPSRIAGWTNREVVAHLAIQPTLLERFLETAAPEQAGRLSLAANLAGTSALGETIDAVARRSAHADLDFESRYRRAVPGLLAADLAVSVTTIQGTIALGDYLRTRCVEAVVHGGDLNPPVNPRAGALEIAAEALLEALSARRADLVALARGLPAQDWVHQATGRVAPTGALADVLPVMS